MKMLSVGLFAMLTFTVVGSASARAQAAPSVEEGKRIYLEKKNKCVACHGEDGRAQTKMGQKDKIPDMTTEEWQKRFSDDAIKAAILKGVEREEAGRKVKMKPMEGATERDAQSLLLFIRSLKTSAAAPQPDGDKKAPKAPEGDKKAPPKDAAPPRDAPPKDGTKPKT